MTAILIKFQNFENIFLLQYNYASYFRPFLNVYFFCQKYLDRRSRNKEVILSFSSNSFGVFFSKSELKM